MESVDITMEEEHEITERVTYPILVPARFYSWEGHHSTV
jgi:hypothetical protein